MSKILADLTRPARVHPGRHVHIVRDEGGLADAEPGKPIGTRSTNSTGRWNRLHMPPVPTHEPIPEVRASGGKRQHLAQIRPKAPRLYRPQDQKNIQTVWVIMDRVTGQVLARVRGKPWHAEVEAEKLARSQGGELSDLKVIFEGELPKGGMTYV